MLDKIYIGEPRDLTITGLKKRSTGAYKNDAEITWELMEADETSIATGDFTYDADSDGDYTATITADDTADLEAGTEYIVEIVSSGITLRRLTPVAEYRGRA